MKAIKQYLVSIEGLPSARVHDLIFREDGARALVSSLRHDAVEAMMLDNVDVRPGQRFELADTDRDLYIGSQLFGRVVNAVCDTVDDAGALPPKNTRLVLQREAGHIAERARVTEQLLSGYAMVDTVLPIGRGQRQLFMGPVQSGMDAFCREVIQNQAGRDMVCVYVTVGKTPEQIDRLATDLYSTAAKEYTCIVAGTSEDTAPMNTIAPSVGLLIAELLAQDGKEVLVVLDDLYTHAKYLREIGLLEGKLPGREAYPGDIFFQQAHLIERAGSFGDRASITLLPLLQTDPESNTDLIMTNVMGTTDGHVSFSPVAFAQGQFPPIVHEESVTRVGKHTQTTVQKQLSTAIVTLLGDAKEQERYAQFGTQLSEATRDMINTASIMHFLLDQVEGVRYDRDTQTVLLALVFTTFATGKQVAFFEAHLSTLVSLVEQDALFADARRAVSNAKSFSLFLNGLEKLVPKLQAACQA